MCELLRRLSKKCMGRRAVQKIMGYSKSNLVTEVTAAEAKARQVAGAADAEVGRSSPPRGPARAM